MEVIKVVATPEAYEWVMNSESEAVRMVLDAAFSYVHKGFTDEEDGQAICFKYAPRLCLRIIRAQSPKEESIVIISHRVFGSLSEMLKSSIPMTEKV